MKWKEGINLRNEVVMYLSMHMCLYQNVFTFQMLFMSLTWMDGVLLNTISINAFLCPMVIFMSLQPTFQVFVIHFSCALLYLFCVVDISIDYAFKQQQAVRNVLNSEQRVRGVWVTHTHTHTHT